MNKGTPKIREFRIKAPNSTRHNQQVTMDFDLGGSTDTSSPKGGNNGRGMIRRREILPSLKKRRANSIV